MRVCLVSAPTIAEFKDLEPIADEVTPRVPLGVLALARVLEQARLRPAVVDLDTEYARWRQESDGGDGFARHAVEVLAARGVAVYGFSTICSSYPLTLRIASGLKKARPDCRIILGGPQATASADETLAAFPAVDVVVRGEGETVLPALLDALASSGDLAGVGSLTYRTPRGVERTPDVPLVEDLDALPFAAYHLYPRLRRGATVPLEVGRGCPFACTFCSTSRFFGRRFRMRSPGRIVEEMLALARTFGTRRFDLVHDNFTVDRGIVLAFCEAVSSAGAGLRWTCSSRTDTLDEELVDVMWRAGCRGLFFGIESGSSAMQQRIDKRLDLSEARRVLRRVSRRRMTSTLSFITGLPDEREEDLRDSVTFFTDALRQDFLEPQLSLLSPLSGTPVAERHRGRLFLDDVVSDMVLQGEEQEQGDRALVERYPEIFSSFYSVPTPWLDRRELDDLRGFLIAARFKLRWLLLAAAQLAGDGLAVFRTFRAWRSRRRRHRSRRALTAYYRSDGLRRDFIRFVREVLVPQHRSARHALLALARYYASLLGEDARRGATAHPALARDIRVTRLGCDGAALLRCLREGGDLSAVPQRPSTVVTRIRNGRDEVLQLTEEAADLLALCDGTRDEAAIARAFGRVHPGACGASAKAASAFGLAFFRRKGFIARTPERHARRRDRVGRRDA